MKHYTTLWVRVKAFFWDYLLITAYLILVAIVFIFLPIAQFFENRIQAQVIGFSLVTLPVILYYTFSESSSKQGTFGKQRQLIKVVDENGKQIPFVRALIRNLLKFLPWEISHTMIWQIQFYPDASSSLLGFGLVYVLIGLNIASVLINKTHQTVYDLITKTFVVRN